MYGEFGESEEEVFFPTFPRLDNRVITERERERGGGGGEKKKNNIVYVSCILLYVYLNHVFDSAERRKKEKRKRDSQLRWTVKRQECKLAIGRKAL